MKNNTKTIFAFLVVLMLVACTSAKSQDSQVIVLEKQILSHPIFLFTMKDEEVVRNNIKTIPLAKEIYTRLLSEAETLLSTPLQTYDSARVQLHTMLGISREQLYRMITLSMAYRITKDSRFLDKAEAELINVCKYPNWDPRHFLDDAEMTMAVSIAYDWLYNELKKETKDLVVQSRKTKALDLAVKEYAEGGAGSWAKRETNWNVVCNSGMVIGAMAVA
jgi:hypothetical protein